MKINIWYAILAVFGIIAFQSFWSEAQHVETIPYSEFKQYLKEGRISEIAVTSESVQGTLKGGEGTQQRHVVANPVNEAALLATRRSAEAVSLEDFTEAIERIVAGLEKKIRLVNPKERKVVAYHEMGHALVAMSLPDTDAVHKVSIIPRGIGALGYTIQRPTEERFLMSRSELQNKTALLPGGRAAETVVFDEISTGAADDLAKASDVARSMVTRFGMAEALGQIAYEDEPQRFLGSTPLPTGPERRDSEETARKIDDAALALVDKAFKIATTIVAEKRATLNKAAEEPLRKETLGGEDPSRLIDHAETSLDVAAASARGG